LPHTPHDELVATCHELVHEMLATVSRCASPELLSLELTMGQLKAMATVTMFGPQPVGELGRRLGISEPAASLLVDKLVELGLASRERDAQDRRRSLVTATPAAEELAGRLRQGRDDQFSDWLGALSGDELASLVTGLRALVREATGGAASSHEAAAPAVRHG
jgi:MarR family transcriptional regulator, 2-MHQ and catechol-resistance regulon repressor